MKKLLALLLTLALLATALVGCGNKDNPPYNDPDQSQSGANGDSTTDGNETVGGDETTDGSDDNKGNSSGNDNNNDDNSGNGNNNDNPTPPDENDAIAVLKYELDTLYNTYSVVGIEKAGGIIQVPTTYENLPVVRIAASAFENCTEVHTITISDGIKRIETDAFAGCENLKTLTIGKDVEYMADETQSPAVFSGTVNFEKIIVSSENERYASYDGVLYDKAFIKIMYVPLSIAGKVTVPEGVTKMGSHFKGRKKLTEISMPQSTTSIFSFEGCKSLTSITIPKNVTSISSGAFAYCDSLNQIVLEEGNATYKCVSNCIIDNYGKLITACNSSVIPMDEGITDICDNAFKGLVGITSITIPDTVEDIEVGVFKDCVNLKTIVLGSKVRSIGDFAFANTAITEVVLPQTVRSIDSEVFYGCSNLKTVRIGKDVTKIGSNAFYGCNIETIEVDSKNSKYKAENNCLISIRDNMVVCGNINGTLPEDVIIASGAFGGMSKLTELMIPDGIVFEAGAVIDCENLEKISSNITDINAKYVVKNNVLIDRYTKTLLLACNDTHIPTDGSVTKLGDYAFSNCFKLESIDIPSCITEIGISAFANSTHLNKVNITDLSAWCMVNIRSHIVAYNHKYILCLNGKDVTDIVIPSDIEEILPFTFANLKNIKTISMHNNVRVIGSSAFYGCDGVTKLVISDSVGRIDTAAFVGCNSLVEITLPSVAKLCDILDSNITTLKTVRFTPGIYGTKVHEGSLEGFSSVETVIIEKGITKIENRAFFGCENVKNMIISENLTYIGFEAFDGCKNLKEIEFSGSREQGMELFYNVRFMSGVHDDIVIKCSDGNITKS